MANQLAEIEASVLKIRRKNQEKMSAKSQTYRYRRSRGRTVRGLTASIDYSVPGPVPIIAQPKRMGCWATVLTMLTNWRNRTSRSIEETLSELGGEWLQVYNDDTGLFPDQERAFLNAAGLQAQRGVNLSPEGWQQLLRENGPIWVTVDMQPGQPGGMHARVVTGIHGSGDPATTHLDIIDPSGGRRYRETFERFLPRYEAEVSETGNMRFQLIYWPQGRRQALQQALTGSRRRKRSRSVAASNVLAADAVDYTVPGIVPVLAQPSGMTCWATVFTMLYSWKTSQSLAIGDAVSTVGPRWRQMFDQNQGMPGSDKVDFVAQAGLVAEPPMNLSVDGWEQMLRDYGPIWVTTDEAPGKPWAIHARIIVGIRGDGTPSGTRFTIIDPAGGRQYEESIAEFIPKYEEEVIRTGYTRIQIIHWPRGARMGRTQSVFPHAASISPLQTERSNHRTPVQPALSRPASILPGAMSSVAVHAMTQSFDVRYNVQLVPQQTGYSCWAAGCAMIVGWRDRISIDPSEIARAVGYWEQYRNGLHPEDTAVLRTWGLVTEAPQTFTVEGFKELLENYGPLWVASAAPGPHIRVVTGIHGDGSTDGTHVHINDPWEQGMTTFHPSNRGSRYTETYREFVRKQSDLASQEMDLNAPIYVAHIPELPDWMRNPAARSLSAFIGMSEAMSLVTITHAGSYRLAYDRLPNLGQGVIEPLPNRDNRNFRGDPSLQTALDNWANYLPSVMTPPNYILTGGLYVDKPGAHGQGKAIDVDGFWWSDTNQFLAISAPSDWQRYLRIEATLRKVFGTVLNYDYNQAHQDHWHCDLTGSTNWRAVQSQVKFVQRALNVFCGEGLTIDGDWGTLSRAAAQRAGYDFSQPGHWDRFLDSIINGRLCAPTSAPSES